MRIWSYEVSPMRWSRHSFLEWSWSQRYYLFCRVFSISGCFIGLINMIMTSRTSPIWSRRSIDEIAHLRDSLTAWHGIIFSWLWSLLSRSHILYIFISSFQEVFRSYCFYLVFWVWCVLLHRFSCFLGIDVVWSISRWTSQSSYKASSIHKIRRACSRSVGW